MENMNWSEKSYECGCEIITDNMGTYEISYCPKHKAATELYEALKITYEYLRDLGVLPNLGGLAREEAQKAIAKVEEGK